MVMLSGLQLFGLTYAHAAVQFMWMHNVGILHPASLCSLFLAYILSTHYILGAELNAKVPRGKRSHNPSSGV